MLSDVEVSQEAYAVLRGYTARIVEWGAGQPLVLIPGIAGGVGLLRPLAAELSASFRVIGYELRGEDDCFTLRRPCSLGDLVDDLDQLLEHTGLERPVLLGVSFGAAIAAEYAARRPNRLSGLVLQGADVRFRRSLLRQIAGQVLSGYPLPSDSPFVNQFFNLLLGGELRDESLFDFITAQCWQTDQSVISYRFRLAERVDLQKVLPAIRTPTLIINGERDVLVTADGLDAYRRGLRQVEFVALPSAGHLAFVTHATETARQVRRFAAQHALVSVDSD
jgi:pimeloyl-ACP methyl ester carboxylesterase